MPTAEQLVGAIELPDSTSIRGRSRRGPLPPGPEPDFGLYLGRSPARWRVSWPGEWIDWPDFGTPRDDVRAAAGIRNAYLLATAGQRVEVACRGGTGRTGTVIACLAILAGAPAGEAITWTRRNYRPRAVETAGQCRWVSWFAGHIQAIDGGRVELD